MDAIVAPWLCADVNMAVERQLFPLGGASLAPVTSRLVYRWQDMP